MADDSVVTNFPQTALIKNCKNQLTIGKDINKSLVEGFLSQYTNTTTTAAVSFTITTTTTQ